MGITDLVRWCFWMYELDDLEKGDVKCKVDDILTVIL